MKTYNIFISHSWSYSDAYEKLERLLRERPYFSWKNYSVPKDDPIHNASNASKLKEAIKAQIIPASCVLVLAGVYASYSKWIDIEIALAKDLNKPIIAILPRGATNTSAVKESADEIVAWNTDSIVDAIQRLCRG